MVARITIGWLMLLMLTACIGGGGGTPTEPTEQEILQANVAKVVLLIQDNDQLADGQAAVSVTAIARDNNNNPVANVPITFTNQSDSAILTPYTGHTDQQGILTTQITNTQVESFLISASAGNKTSDFVTVNFIGNVEVSKMTLLVNNNNQLFSNDTPIILTAIARDSRNNPIENISIIFNSQSDSAILTPYTGHTNQQGVLTTQITNSRAESFLVNATAGNQSSEFVRVNFIDDNITANKITLLVNNNNQLINTDPITLTAIARNSDNLPMANVPIDFISSSETVILEPFAGVTNQQGIFTTSITSNIAQTFEIFARSNTLQSQKVSLSFDDGRVDVGKITLLVDENNQLADGQSVINLTAIARDSSNIPLGNLTIGFNSNSETAIFSQFTGQTNVQGLITTQITNTVPETLDVYAQSGTVRSSPVRLTFVNHLTDKRVKTTNLIVSNNFQRADGTSTILLDVTARDAQGDLIPNVQISLSPSSDSAVFASLNGVTNEIGHFTTTVTSTLAENFTVTPIAGGVRGQAQEITFIPPADSLALSAHSYVLAANETANLTLTLYQGDDNPIPLAGANFSVQVTGSAQVENLPKITDATGQARFQVTNSKAENVNVTVSSGQFTQTITLYFGATLTLLPSESNAIGSATLSAILKDANQAAIVEQPVNFNFIGNNNETLNANQLLTGADGVAVVTVNDVQRDGGQVTVKASSGEVASQAKVSFKAEFGRNRTLELNSNYTLLGANHSAIVTARVIDNNGLPVAGQTIHFTATAGTISTRTEQTNIDGEATTRITANGNVQVTASADTAQQTIPLYFGANISLIPPTANGTADGNTATTLTAIVTDNNGVAIQGVAVDFQITQGKGFLQGSPAVSNENGRAEVGVISSDVAPLAIKANTGNISSNTSQIEFFATGINPNVANVELIVSNSPQIADGQGKIQLTAIVRDINGVALAGIPVNFISESNTAFFSAISGITAENGRFSSDVSNNVVEEFSVTVNAGGMSSEAVTLIFNALAVNAITIDASETVLSLDDTVEVTVTLFNNSETNQQPLPNTPFTASVSGNAQLNNVPERTDSNGQARFTVTNNTIQNVTMSIISGTVLQTVELYFGASLVLLPTTTTVVGETILTALLKDGNHTPLNNETLYFSFAASNNETLTPIEARTNQQGITTVTVTDLNKDGGGALVQVSRGSLRAQAEVRFIAQLPDGSRLLVSAPNQVLPVNAKATVIAQMTDNLGLPLINQLVNFSATSETVANIDIKPNRGTTDESGQIQTQISTTQAETVDVNVEVGGMQQTVALYFGAKLSLAPVQASVVADAEISSPITATVTDAFNIPLANVLVSFSYYFDANQDNQFSNDELQEALTIRSDEQGQATINVQSQQQGKGQIIAKAGLLNPVTATVEFTALPVQRIVLKAEKQDLALMEQTQITATVVDKYGNPIVGENVLFNANMGTIGNEAITDLNGQAQVGFSAGSRAGTAIITARVGSDISSVLNLNIQSGDADAIELLSIEPRELGVLGSGTAQTTNIEFIVKDNAGNPVNGRSVQFSLGDTGLNGGESLIFNSAVSNNGVVATILRTGVVSGTVDVIASVENSNATAIARVPIVSNTPDAKHLSLAAEFLNIAGGVQFGIENLITAFVGDRYGNVVVSDTSVSFVSEGGLIGQSVGQAFTTTTVLGRATAILQSAAPTTPNLKGLPFTASSGYSCSDYRFITGSNQTLCGNPGFTTVVAYTTGSESYTDLNGNGRYDANEPYEDLTEPYIDANDSGQFEEGELYIDVDQNNRFTGANGQFDSNTTIWSSVQILFSARTQVPTVTPTSFAIPNGGTQQFLVSGFDNLSLSDIYGNALVSGTNITITSSGGILSGATAFEIDDIAGRGLPEFLFALSSEPPDEEGKYPQAKDVVITIKITSGDTNSNEAPGGNGDWLLSFTGRINN